MKTYKEFHNQAYQTSILRSHGYRGPYKGADGHISFLYGDYQELLIDLPGNEWHFMFEGVVICVGSMDDNSLKDFLNNKPSKSIETEEKEKPYRPRDKEKELHKQDPEGVYQPDGGNYSGASPSSMG